MKAQNKTSSTQNITSQTDLAGKIPNIEIINKWVSNLGIVFFQQPESLEEVEDLLYYASSELGRFQTILKVKKLWREYVSIYSINCHYSNLPEVKQRGSLTRAELWQMLIRYYSSQKLPKKKLFECEKLVQLENGILHIDSNFQDVFNYFDVSRAESKLDRSKSLLLSGSYGVGKTALLESLRVNSLQPFIIKNAQALCNEYQANGYEGLEQYIKPYTAFSTTFNRKIEYALLIDDLCKENPQTKHYGDAINVVAYIIARRYEAGLVTHFTTNENSKTVGEFYGNYILSRILGSCNLVRYSNTVDIRPHL